VDGRSEFLRCVIEKEATKTYEIKAGELKQPHLDATKIVLIRQKAI